MKKIKFIIITLITLLVTGICAYFIMPVINKINFGLDLQGGFEVLYEVSPLKETDELTEDMLYSTYKQVLKRIDILGVSEPEITIEGDNHIRVKLAGITNIDDARDTISSTATLTFRDYNDNLLMTSDVLGGQAKVTKDQYGKPAVSLKINDVDTFYEVTKKVKDMDNNIMVIWLDYQEGKDSYRKELLNAEKYDKENKEFGGCGSTNSHCLSAAQVSQAFASDVIIQGNFTKDEAESLVELINSGALPTNLKEISSRTVEASFGEKALDKTLLAGVIGIGIIILLMTIIYRFSGLIAGLCLIIYTFISFLVFYLIDGVLTLPGIAAMLLGIGMAVDANIISFERIKENLLIGKGLKESFEIGNKNSLSSIVDANVTTVVAAIIMFIFGQSSVKGFATMLIINIIVTALIIIYLVRFILKLIVSTEIFNNKLGLFIGVNKKKISKKKEIEIPFKKLNFIKHKNKFILLAVILLSIGMISLFTRGANLGIDYTGGTSITVSKEHTATETLEQYLKDNNYTIEKSDDNQEEINIKLRETLEKDDITTLKNNLLTEYNLESDIYVVSSVVKKELVKNAILSLIYASIGIVIYVAIRFKFNYAISGIIALLHDILFTFLFFCVFKIEIDGVFIAAILTIIGYSINDTIVTFDIIRDNYKNKYKNNITNPKDLDILVDISIKRTLYRTILTTLTTTIPVITLLILGSKEIMNFNIALLVGFIAGVYSSIFISNMLWLYLEKRRISKPISDEDDDDEIQELKVKGINC